MMSNQQRFDCDICGQEALTESNLRTHLLVEHEENAGSCPLCDLGHLTLEELNWHVNTAHHSVLSPERITPPGPVVVGLSAPESSKQIDPGPVINGFGTASEFELQTSSHRGDKKQGMLNSGEDQLSETSFKNGDGTSAADVDRKKKIPVDSSAYSPGRERFKRTPSASCACTFSDEEGNVKEGTSSSGAHRNTADRMLLNGCAETEEASDDPSENLENGYEGSAPSWNDSVNLERKRTRSEAKLSTSSTSSSAVDVNVAAEESSRRPSLSSTSSTVSPFKKIFRIFSPKKSSKSAGKKDTENAAGVSFKKESDAIWNNEEAESDLISDPECPFCDISGLDSEEMERHVECEHGEVLCSPGSKTPPAQIGHHWNTSMIQRPSSPAPPRPTLLSLSKQAQNLQTVATCPICGLGSYDPDFLTLHINTEHPVPGDAETNVPSQEQGATASTSKVPHDLAGPSTACADSLSGLSDCPVCGMAGLDAMSLTLHVDGHFEVKTPESFSGDRQLAQQLAEEEKQLQERRQKETFKQLQAKYGMDDGDSYRQQSEKDLETAVVRGQITVTDYHQQRGSLRRSLAEGVDDGKSRTAGLIQKMAAYYAEQTIPGLTYVRLCSETDHYSSTYGDKGWGCGYRNLQMLLSSLVHVAEYRRVLFSGKNCIPSISKLQQLIEAAWAKGFDPQGKEQLGGRVVNSRKWIGATEIVAFLSSLRAKCRLMDFHTPTGPGGTHPAMFEWVRDYFGKPGASTLKLRVLSSNSRKAESNITRRPPLYLQHEGHSRTIVGCEVHKDTSIRLLLFDPSYKVNDKQGLGSAKLDAYAMRPIRKSLTQMKAKQYQIVSVDRLMTTDQDYEQSKILRSVRKP